MGVPPVRQRLAAVDPYAQVAWGYSDHYATRRDDAESRLVYEYAIKKADGGCIVDIGCGDGIALRWLAEQDYIGVDPSRAMIHAAAKNWPGYTFWTGTLESVPSYCADFVLGAFGPLIHIEDVESFAKEIDRVLWPGREFLVMGATRGVVRATGEKRVTHTKSELRETFLTAGLQKVRVRGLRWFGRPWFVRFGVDRCEWLVVTGRKRMQPL